MSAAYITKLKAERNALKERVRELERRLEAAGIDTRLTPDLRADAGFKRTVIVEHSVARRRSA